jgi:hypothetical protein
MTPFQRSACINGLESNINDLEEWKDCSRVARSINDFEWQWTCISDLEL